MFLKSMAEQAKQEESRMRGVGALVFLVVFFAMLAATLAYPTIPPGPQLYDMLSVTTINDYLVLGVPMTILAIAIFNGVI